MATHFELFPELPTEIQIEIWKLNCEVPRIIELGATPENWLWRGRAIEDVNIWKRIELTSNSSRGTLIPAALETCVLSREVALKFYNHLVSGRCWFNPAIDTLYFGKDWEFTEGWDHWRGLVRKNKEIRHFAFHLPTVRYRQDFFCITEVAEKRQVEGITFILDAPIESSGDAVVPRFRIIDHQEIASNKALGTVGKVFKEAQSAIITESFDFENRCFREFGYYPDGYSPWKIPKIRFMLEDEQQAQQDREARRVRQELAAIAKEEAEYKVKTYVFLLLSVYLLLTAFLFSHQ